VAHATEPRLLVLHGLRLKGFAEAEALAALVGLSAETVASELDVLAGAGLTLHRDGRLSGWTLTPAGRAEHGAAMSAAVDAAGVRDRIDGAYRSFLGLNGELLAVCTAWQMRDESTLNDHADAAYDAGVVDRLGALNDRVAPVLDALSDTFDRFGPYRERFDAALEKLRAGDNDYFAKPMIDSYHTVWFELHEDLLSTLGFERSKEVA
jgi:hypothetical protein